METKTNPVIDYKKAIEIIEVGTKDFIERHSSNPKKRIKEIKENKVSSKGLNDEEKFNNTYITSLKVVAFTKQSKENGKDIVKKDFFFLSDYDFKRQGRDAITLVKLTGENKGLVYNRNDFRLTYNEKEKTIGLSCDGYNAKLYKNDPEPLTSFKGNDIVYFVGNVVYDCEKGPLMPPYSTVDSYSTIKLTKDDNKKSLFDDMDKIKAFQNKKLPAPGLNIPEEQKYKWDEEIFKHLITLTPPTEKEDTL